MPPNSRNVGWTLAGPYDTRQKCSSQYYLVQLGIGLSGVLQLLAPSTPLLSAAAPPADPHAQTAPTGRHAAQPAHLAAGRAWLRHLTTPCQPVGTASRMTAWC
jgi:hypothetical protein